jgi:CheY-like chemotaxis protein
VSAYTHQGRIELNGDAVGVIDWLEKPIDTARLLQAVQQAVLQHADSLPQILHVEDDRDVAQIIAAVLQEVATVTCAASLAEAKQCLEGERFDLILLDMGLPDGSGLELLPMLARSTTPPTPVIIFSAQDVTVETTQQVSATLVKSRTSNQQFLDTILSLINRDNARVGTPQPTTEA